MYGELDLGSWASGGQKQRFKNIIIAFMKNCGIDLDNWENLILSFESEFRYVLAFSHYKWMVLDVTKTAYFSFFFHFKSYFNHIYIIFVIFYAILYLVNESHILQKIMLQIKLYIFRSDKRYPVGVKKSNEDNFN